MQAYGGVDILVVASGMNDVSPIVDMAPGAIRASHAGQRRRRLAHRARRRDAK